MLKLNTGKENRDGLYEIQEILEFIRLNEKTIREISTSLRIPVTTVHKNIRNLIILGWVKEIPDDMGFEGNKYLAVAIQLNISSLKSNMPGLITG